MLAARHAQRARVVLRLLVENEVGAGSVPSATQRGGVSGRATAARRSSGGVAASPSNSSGALASRPPRGARIDGIVERLWRGAGRASPRELTAAPGASLGIATGIAV
jgi:hypothetical protein